MTDILNLSGFKVVGIEESEFDYRIEAEVANHPTTCPNCKTGGQALTRYGMRYPVFMDTPIHGKRVGIRVHRQRYWCKPCEKAFADPLPHINEDRKMTDRLVSFIKEQAFKRTFTSVAEEIGVTEGTIRAVFNAYVKKLEAEYLLEPPRWMGIDELTLLGKPRCIMTNVGEKTILDILKTRNKPAVVRRLLEIPGRELIEIVTMDMWSPYKEAVNAALPQAQIVIDKFHIVKMANKCLNDLRKSIRGQMTTSQRRLLMRERHILLKRRQDLDADEKIKRDEWLGHIPLLEQAYWIKEAFFDIFELKEAKDRKEAERQYDIWLDTLNEEIEPYFQELTTAMTNWREEIFAYFDHQTTNAYTEAINGLIKVANRLGRGYSFEVIRAKMIFNGRVVRTRPAYGSEFHMVMDIASIPDHLRRQLMQPIPNWCLGASISTITELIERGEIRSK